MIHSERHEREQERLRQGLSEMIDVANERFSRIEELEAEVERLQGEKERLAALLVAELRKPVNPT